jgi:hypothetical protein
MFLDRPPGRVLNAGQHEVRNCPPLEEGRRMVDKCLLLRRQYPAISSSVYRESQAEWR